MSDIGELVLTLSRAVEGVPFTSSEWTELSYLTDTFEYVNGHPRLLRSLLWGDDDYKGHAIDAVAFMIKKDPTNLRKMVEFPALRVWLSEHDAIGLRKLQGACGGPSGDLAPEFLPHSTSEIARDAIEDAKALLIARGPTSAVDRVHTGLHAFLKRACEEQGIQLPSDATLTQFLKALMATHPNLSDLGPRSDEVQKMLRTSTAILDALSTIRNNVSRAHPNEALLLQEEALLAINICRSLLQYLDGKLQPPPF